MSSYLTFYLKPKGQDKPLMFTSYSRSTDIYQAYYEELHPAFIGNGDEPNYTELTSEMALQVVNAAKEDLKKAETALNNRIAAYKELGNMSDEAVQDIAETKDYIEDLKSNLIELQCIYCWVGDIEYSDFEKVLINID